MKLDIKFAEEEIRRIIDKAKEELVEPMRNCLRLGNDNDRLDDLTRNLQSLTNRLNELEGAIKQGPRLDEQGDLVRYLQQSMDNITNGENENSLRRKVEEIHGKVGDIHGKTAELYTRFDDINESVATIVGFQANIEKIGGISDGVSKILDMKNSEYQELLEKVAELPGLREKLQQAETAYNTLKRELGETKTSLDTTKNNLQSAKESLEQKEQELENAQAAKTALEVWRKKTAVYAPIRDTMKKCPVFENFLKNEIADSEEETELFALAQAMGKTMDFPKSVHQWAKGYKKDNLNPMGEDEIAVYQALNSFYRDLWKVDWDIFTMPGRTPVGDGIQKNEFNRNESDNFPDPKKQITKIQDVYVPLLLDKEGKKVNPAQVKTSNL